MNEHRTEERIICYGHIFAGNQPGHLRDVNGGGCKITTMAPLANSQNGPIDFRIIPDSETGLTAIPFQGTIRWSIYRSGFYYYGIQVESFPSEDCAERYGRLALLYGS